MSAFIVSKKHIDLLVTFAVNHKVCYWFNEHWINVTKDTAKEAGQILVDENYRSVSHRYGDRAEGYFGKPTTYKFERAEIDDTVVLLKQCDCYGYQACETDDYRQTAAHALINSIKDRAISKLPGYANAPWGI